MSRVEIKNVSKSYGDVLAVDNVSLDVREGELLGLLGPSGCGKTTLLRLMSGFLTPSGGEIYMGGKDVTDLPPERRPTSLVFQNYALFPHLSVFENIAFGLKVKKMPMKEIRREVQEMLEIVGLSGTENRSIRQLSGGQQQRIALARALVMKPQVLLLDEPLCNLDAKLRVETRMHIQRIQKALGITSIFVTHDQEEALSICDRIVVMNKGNVVQVGTPEEVYSKPNSRFAADFIGKSNILKGALETSDDGKVIFRMPNGDTLKTSNPDLMEGQASLLIRPENISVSTGESGGENRNVIQGEIEHVTYLGEVTYFRVSVSGGGTLLVPVYGKDHREFHEGQTVYLSWNMEDGLLIREEGM